MGIAERKAAGQFEETVYPKQKKEVDAAAHFVVPVEVDRSTQAVDEPGREALRSTLKRSKPPVLPRW